MEVVQNSLQTDNFDSVFEVINRIALQLSKNIHDLLLSLGKESPHFCELVAEGIAPDDAFYTSLLPHISEDKKEHLTALYELTRLRREEDPKYHCMEGTRGNIKVYMRMHSMPSVSHKVYLDGRLDGFLKITKDDVLERIKNMTPDKSLPPYPTLENGWEICNHLLLEKTPYAQQLFDFYIRSFFLNRSFLTQKNFPLNPNPYPKSIPSDTDDPMYEIMKLPFLLGFLPTSSSVQDLIHLFPKMKTLLRNTIEYKNSAKSPKQYLDHMCECVSQGLCPRPPTDKEKKQIHSPASHLLKMATVEKGENTFQRITDFCHVHKRSGYAYMKRWSPFSFDKEEPIFIRFPEIDSLPENVKQPNIWKERKDGVKVKNLKTLIRDL